MERCSRGVAVGLFCEEGRSSIYRGAGTAPRELSGEGSHRRQVFSAPLLGPEYSMDIDLVLARLRAAAASREPGWLEAQVGDLLVDEAGGSRAESRVSPRARRSRPPERYSPTPTSRVQRPSRSPLVEPSPPLAKRTHAAAGGDGGRNPPPSLGPVGGASGRYCARTSTTQRSSGDGSAPPPVPPGPEGGDRSAGEAVQQPGGRPGSGPPVPELGGGQSPRSGGEGAGAGPTQLRRPRPGQGGEDDPPGGWDLRPPGQPGLGGRRRR